jgi:hypothetical protein
MASPTLEFVIHILESPKPEELLTSKHEGPALQKALELAGIKSQLHIVVNDTMLRKCVHDLTDAFQNHGPTALIPVLHFSAHGSKEGIQLTDGTTCKWAEFGAIIAPLNKALDGNLVIFMSTCHGYSGLAMARSASDLPFGALIGADDEITWQQALLAFHTVYYHFFHCGSEFEVAVKAMNAALGFDKPRFELAHGEEVRAAFNANVSAIVKRARELMALKPK